MIEKNGTGSPGPLGRGGQVGFLVLLTRRPELKKVIRVETENGPHN